VPYQQEVGHNRQDAPDRHPRIGEQVKKTHDFGSADGEANLRAEQPIVKKNMSVPNTTAVLRMPTRDTVHIQWFIAHPPFSPSPRRVAGIFPADCIRQCSISFPSSVLTENASNWFLDAHDQAQRPPAQLLASRPDTL
jgi:hypothetical protein